jgi:hypothetical protein
VGQDSKDVAEVLLGIEPVEACRRDEGKGLAALAA